MQLITNFSPIITITNYSHTTNFKFQFRKYTVQYSETNFLQIKILNENKILIHFNITYKLKKNNY